MSRPENSTRVESLREIGLSHHSTAIALKLHMLQESLHENIKGTPAKCPALQK